MLAVRFADSGLKDVFLIPDPVATARGSDTYSLLRLDAERVGANCDLLVRLDDGALFTRQFAAGD